MIARILSSLLVIGSFYVIIPRVTYGDVAEVLGKINARPPPERERLLTENAKKEAALTFYSGTNSRDLQEIVTAFNKRYPFIKVAFSSLGGPGVLNKVLTEHRAGVDRADVVATTGTYLVDLIDKGILAKYKSPMVPYLRKGFVDAEGFWPGVDTRGYTVIYNTKRVSPNEAPRRYEDLLLPRWKRNMIMDVEAYNLFAGLVDLWGQEKAVDFLKKLAGEQAVLFSRQSHAFMTQLVATGEHDLIVDGYVHNAVAMKEKGAPLEYVVFNPTILMPPNIIAIMSGSSNPHAAALFVDYNLSKEASEIMVKNQGRWAPRRDVAWTVEPEAELHVVSALEWGRKLKQLVDVFKKTAGQ
jgi:iron(III) transport system substrate-binding protein